MQIGKEEQHKIDQERSDVQMEWEMSKEVNRKDAKENTQRRFKKIIRAVNTPLKELNGIEECLVYQGKRKRYLRNEDEDKGQQEIGVSKKNKCQLILEDSSRLRGEEETIPKGSPVVP